MDEPKPAKEPKAAKAKPTVAEALEVLKESGIMDLLRTGDLGEKEREEIQQRELDAFRQLVGRTAQERTQEKVDKLYTGSKRFRVGLPDGNGFPMLVIPADSATDARARYEQVCGIRHTENEYVIAAEGTKASKDFKRFTERPKKGTKHEDEPAMAEAG